ncbi:FkbM family methyltransferase, partial [Mesorhizobium sp. M7A.F.Ca.CA.001.06.1.1]
MGGRGSRSESRCHANHSWRQVMSSLSSLARVALSLGLPSG